MCVCVRLRLYQLVCLGILSLKIICPKRHGDMNEKYDAYYVLMNRHQSITHGVTCTIKYMYFMHDSVLVLKIFFQSD